MAALPYMQLYVADYLADTAHLTTVENGAYLLLIFNYWQRGESFKAKDEQSLNRRLASVARMSNEEWENVKESISEFFNVSETEWEHLRIERDLASVNSKSEKAKAAGKASAASKANARSTNVEQTISHTDTDTESDTDTEKTKPSAQIQRLDCSPELFEEFWTNYPRRPGSSKADSLKAWKARIKDGADPLIIVGAAAKYATYCQATATEPQFIKQPATFLGPGKHYESDWTPPPRASPRMSHNDSSKLSAARTIFGTEVEGTANATGRIIDITPAASGSLGSEDFSRDAGKLRLAVSEPVENWAGR